MTKEAELAISSVPFSKLESDWRLDPEYYQSHYLHYQALFAKCPRLETLSSAILHPIEVKRDYVDSGIQILLAQNIRQNYLDFALSVYLPQDLEETLAKNLLQPGDVVMTRSGVNYGDSATYLGEPPLLYASADCLVIRPQSIDGTYLSTFFNTRYGKDLLKRGGYGAAQPHIAPTYVGELRVPREDTVEREIVKLVNQSRETQRESKRLYRQAKRMLLDELGLNDLELSDGLHSDVSFSRAWGVHRIDAEYFRPRCLATTKTITNCGYPVHFLQELLIAPLTNGATPPGADYTDGDVVFLTAENIRELQLWPDDKRITAEFSNNVLARSRPEPGDLLITIKGKVGAAAVVPKFEGEWNINQDVARARIDPSLNPHYLAVFFESELGQAQTDRMTTGAINPFLGLGNLLNFPIPIPPRDVQDKFEKITQRIIENHRRSRTFLEQAKRKVEALIESKAVHD